MNVTAAEYRSFALSAVTAWAYRRAMCPEDFDPGPGFTPDTIARLLTVVRELLNTQVTPGGNSVAITDHLPYRPEVTEVFYAALGTDFDTEQQRHGGGSILRAIHRPRLTTRALSRSLDDALSLTTPTTQGIIWFTDDDHTSPEDRP